MWGQLQKLAGGLGQASARLAAVHTLIGQKKNQTAGQDKQQLVTSADNIKNDE